MEKTLPCPFCGATGRLRPASIVKHLSPDDPPLYVCDNYPVCDAYVRCHKGSDRPFGTMANRRLRRLRKAAHLDFDMLWKECGELGRPAAYQAAGHVMGVSGEFHIGELDEEGCVRFMDRLSLIQLEFENRMLANRAKLNPPLRQTLDVLLQIFHPKAGVYLKTVAVDAVEKFGSAYEDAIRCGLLQVTQQRAALSPRGQSEVFDVTMDA